MGFALGLFTLFVLIDRDGWIVVLVRVIASSVTVLTGILAFVWRGRMSERRGFLRGKYGWGELHEKRSADRARLLRVAEQQYASVRDREVYSAWHVVVEAIRRSELSIGGVAALIGKLVSGGGVSGHAHSIEVDHEGDPTRVVVSFVRERYTCPRDELICELRRLDQSVREQT